jgi:hypothetical protein
MSPLTLAEALDLPQGEVEELSLSELHLSPNELRAAGSLWLALLDVADDGSADAREAWFAVATDPPLCVALHRDAVSLLDWWRKEDWSAFDQSDPGGEAWAWQVLDRLRAVVGSLGCWAGQVVLSADLVRGVCGNAGGQVGAAGRRIEIAAPGH